ncbi:FAD-dependent monooxygenase [Corynebacterium frankenforstense]
MDIPVRRVAVLIVGAGPTGLALANLLGQRGVDALIADERETLIGYPRAVGIDDDSLRLVQQLGLEDEVRAHYIPGHHMRVVNGSGKVLATFDAPGSPNGYSRKNAFHQGEVDRVLARGVDRFDSVELRLGTRVHGVEDTGACVRARVGDEEVLATWLVDCEGGSSAIRKQLGIDFGGQTDPTRWLVVDVADDPVGVPGGFLGADARRPYVSIGLPHGLRRMEFLLGPREEPTEQLAEKLVRGVAGGDGPVRITRCREFKHHSRVAETMRVGRVILAGDAAHLMPVWLGQGMNSGLRDAANLAWKLAGVVAGRYAENILDTYETERRPHVQAMVEQSTLVGRFVAMRGKRNARLRDVIACCAGKVPALRRRITEMRFKPLPRLTEGVVLGALPAGTMFPQPQVTVRGRTMLFDAAVGPEWTVVAYNALPELPAQVDGVVAVRRVVPVSAARGEDLGDGGALHAWFAEHRVGAVLLRPDRYIAAAGTVADMYRVVGEISARYFRCSDFDTLPTPVSGNSSTRRM